MDDVDKKSCRLDGNKSSGTNMLCCFWILVKLGDNKPIVMLVGLSNDDKNSK